MNIFTLELRMHLRSTIIWTVALLLLVAGFAFGFPVIRQNVAAMNGVLQMMPEGLKKSLGLNVIDLSQPIGVMGFLFMYITLVAAVQAMSLGLSVLSVELRDKTADFLLSKPVKRITIVHAKLAAAITCILSTNLIFAIVARVALDLLSTKPYPLSLFLALVLSVLFIQLFFVSLGALVSVFLSRMKTVIPLALGVVFGFFIVNLLNESLRARPLTPFSPFAYFSTGTLFSHQGFAYLWVGVNFLLVAAFVTGTYLRYLRKDMPSV